MRARRDGEPRRAERAALERARQSSVKGSSRGLGAYLIDRLRVLGRGDGSSAARVEPRRMIERSEIVRAGNVESDGVEVLPGSRIALFTTIGPGSYHFNEDAAVAGLGVDRRELELGYLGVFDQAGGQGKLKSHGEASRVAAEKFVESMEEVLAGNRWPGAEALKAAASAANAEIIRRNEERRSSAVTTFVAALTERRVAHVVNCGDSRAVLFGPRGDIKAATALHNWGALEYRPRAPIALYANRLQYALGFDEDTVIDAYRWPTTPGDWLVLFTDGLGDANQIAQEARPREFTEYHTEITTRAIADRLSRVRSAAEAAEALRAYAVEMVEMGRGKGDNISIVVQQIT